MVYRSFIISGFVILLLLSPAISKEGAKMNQFSLESSAFKNNGTIPNLYTCDGKDINPPLTIRNVPAGAKSLVLIVDDPDAPAGIWVHWVVWNIDPSIKEIPENSVPAGAMQGRNDFKKTNYGGPCPPSGTHRYFFKAYALDTTLNLKNNSTKQDVESAMKGHTLAESQVIGLYKRQ
ncbi:MAG: YbhB/YbcL family Raf kinase inhibitor-like protein [Syntrophorhabdaceae bacterium]